MDFTPLFWRMLWITRTQQEMVTGSAMDCIPSTHSFSYASTGLSEHTDIANKMLTVVCGHTADLRTFAWNVYITRNCCSYSYWLLSYLGRSFHHRLWQGGGIECLIEDQADEWRRGSGVEESNLENQDSQTIESDLLCVRRNSCEVGSRPELRRANMSREGERVDGDSGEATPWPAIL